MTKYREHRELYTRDFTRYSIYPSIKRPEEFSTKKLHPGQILVVDISDIDERGRGIAQYANYVIKVNGGGTVGDKVRVKISKVGETEALAEVIEFL